MRTVSAVIVNWNTADLLEGCLRSIASEATGFEVETIVVDNASSDGSVAMLERDWPEVKVLVNPTNVGYQRANNQALAVAGGELLLLINADAALRPGALRTMVARLDGDPNSGAVGPRLVYGDGSWQRWTAGRAPGLASTASFYLFAERVSRRWASRSVFMAADVRQAFQPDWVSSACMLVRAQALVSVGPMDERYFCYMDDVDLCQRMRDGGWHVWYEPAAEVVHLMGQSTRRATGAPSPAAIRNYNDYVTRQRGALVGAGARAAEAVGFTARSLIYGAQAIVRRSPAHARSARQHLRNARISLSWGSA
jgi:N-acetylglucosaminyl-diphospho-decaprenol L-rhamnosyltransferase